MVRRLIALFGPNFRVSYATEALPDSMVVASLRDCVDLRELIRGGFCLVDAPPATITIPLGKICFPQGSPL